MHCRLAVLVVALASALAGCEQESVECACAPCPLPSVAVVVSDWASGGPVAGVTVTGGETDWICAEADGKTRCTPQGGFVASVPFTVLVEAPGYAPGSTEVAGVTPPPSVSPRRSCPCGDCPTYTADPVVLLPL